MRKGSNRGFTLIEVIISTLLISVGVVATISTFGSISATANRLNRSETAQKLAREQLNEIVGTQSYTQSNLSGEWSDNDYAWSAAVNPTGVENLQTITVTITKKGKSQAETTATAYIYVPPTNTGGGGQ